MKTKGHYASKYFSSPARALPIPFKVVNHGKTQHIRNVLWEKNFGAFKLVDVDYIRSDEDYDALSLISETKESH